MRKIVFCLLAGILTALVTARALLPESARAASDGELFGYNLCNINLPITTETAGSALLADLNGYFLFRTPTAKNDWTGVFEGKDLILIAAENWRVPARPSRYGEGALYRLDRGSARISEVYRTDWFQGSDGLSFALLTGIVPTTADDMTALEYTGRQDIYYPYTLARTLSKSGYACSAFIRDDSQREGLEALGFHNVTACDAAAEDLLRNTLEEETGKGRFFSFYLWEDEDCTEALECLFDALKDLRRLDGTVICLLSSAEADGRGCLYIYGAEAKDAVSARPCSALDVTPTLLNLFGIEYDSRFLSGLDVFCTNSETGTARAVTPVVSLYGSAFSDWVTDAGSFSSAGSIFRQTADCFEDSAAVSAYVHEISRIVYDRYTYARKAMEYNYYRIAIG